MAFLDIAPAIAQKVMNITLFNNLRNNIVDLKNQFSLFHDIATGDQQRKGALAFGTIVCNSRTVFPSEAKVINSYNVTEAVLTLSGAWIVRLNREIPQNCSVFVVSNLTGVVYRAATALGNTNYIIIAMLTAQPSVFLRNASVGEYLSFIVMPGD